MKLPPNWTESSLGEICSQPQYGYTTKGSDTGTLRLLRTTDITSGNICWDNVPFCLENPADEDKYLLEDGDIVISRAGSVGVSYLLKNPERSVFASYLIRFKPYINTQYFKYFLDSPYYWQEIAYNKLGIAVPNVNASKLKEIAIPLAPINEQHRIVAKIEELFSELDKGIENLKTAQAQLKVYRQALLKHAFEGKLTAQWRAENQDKLESADTLLKRIQQERAQRYQQQLADWETSGKQSSKPKAPKLLPSLTAEELAKLPELPEGWGWVRPEEICVQEPYAIGIGPFGSNLKVSDYRENGMPLIFVKNITRSNFSIDLKFIDEVKFKELIPHSVKSLDLLITKMGDPPGDCEIYPDGSPNAVLTADCLKFRLWNEFANRKLYKFCINSNFIKRQLGLITKGVAQKKISVERFKTICLPLFSIEEQKILIQEIESKLSECDQLDQTITTALQQAEALRQSILKKAFSGQLVPQDPNDEPASELLARIRAEKAASSNNVKGNQRSARKKAL